MPESLKFIGKAGDSIEISKFGNLLSWVTIDGLDRINPTGQGARKARDGYAFLYGDQSNPSVIYDVGDDRTPGLTPILLASEIPNNSEIDPGVKLEVKVVVEASDDKGNVFHIAHIFIWKAGGDELDVVRAIENRSSHPVNLIAVKSHSALLAGNSSTLPSKSLIRKNNGGLALILDDPQRGPCSAPPPDDCLSVEFSGGLGETKIVSLVATPANFQQADFKTNFLGANVIGSVRRQLWTSPSSVKDWQLTLGRDVNEQLSAEQSFSFDTHYQLHQGKQQAEPQPIGALAKTVASVLSTNESQPEAIAGVKFGMPGNLQDFGSEAEEEWNEKLREKVQRDIRMSGTRHFIVAQPSTAIDVITWKGNPEGVDVCLQSQTKAMKLADWNSEAGDIGRTLCHEEYLEWRTVRNPEGKIVRVEMTTENQEYWITLARHEPKKLLSLVAQFAGEPSVEPEQIYGTSDFESLLPEDREQQFRNNMMPSDNESVPPISPYNNGIKAICFLYKERNSLAAAINLLSLASFPFARMGTAGVQPTDGKDIILSRLNKSIQRPIVESTNSDPAIVGNIARQALNGKRFTLDSLPGVYIIDVDSARLTLPDGKPMPKSWLKFERGSGDGRYQRLIFSAPDDNGPVVGDLIDSGTNEKIEFGYQLARLVEVGIYYSVIDNIDTTPIDLGNESHNLINEPHSLENERRIRMLRGFEKLENHS